MMPLMRGCAVRACRAAEIFDDRASTPMIAEYAAECSFPGAEPQYQLYAAMEEMGSLHCFAAYVGEELAGFTSLLTAFMPHNGRLQGVIESIYVSPEHRNTGAGNELLTAAEAAAKELGCALITYLPRKGSAFEVVLSRRAGCKATHTQFTRWL